MKRVIALLLAAAMLPALAACAGKSAQSAPSAAQSASPENKVYKIGIAVYDYHDAFMALYMSEVESYFNTLNEDGVSYVFTIADGKGSQKEQNKQLEDFISQKVDAIILNLVETSTAEPMIDKIAEAGIPLVLVNREPRVNGEEESYPGIVDNEKVCYVGANAQQSGEMQGEIIRDLPNHGDVNGDGKVGYIMIEGDPENLDAKYRTEYSVKTLLDAGIKLEKVDGRVGDWRYDLGKEIAAIDLAKHGDAVEVVFCNNDAMALGAAVSIAAAGRTVGKDIYLVGVDALDVCVEMVENGSMTGTVRNDYISQSHKAVDVAVAAIRGEPIENYYWIDYVKIVK
ncbi:MAG: LacI family transcriptional regulator [Ruminococcaceae bacterium]|nr:LacI family transcriptional regulator [Oscillospiraceae bacterium]